MRENETVKSLVRRARIKADFIERGESIAGWARKHGFMPRLIYDLLDGRTYGKSGEANRAAVLLGLKEGAAENTAQGA